MRPNASALLVLLWSLTACSPPAAPPEPQASPALEAWFSEEAAERGVEVTFRSRHSDRRLFPQIMGGGLALADLDGDDDLDLIVGQTSGQGPNGEKECTRLFRNRGSGRFVDDTPASLGELCGEDMGFALGDIEGDGDLDVYLTRLGTNVLLANDGAGHFHDVTATNGAGVSGWSTSAAFFDAEGDGDLDLFVARYVEWNAARELDCRSASGLPDYCSPQSYAAPARSVLLRNDHGRYSDVSLESGVGTLPGTALGVIAANFDGVPGAEIFVANDGMPNRLWRREAGGAYRDVAAELGCAVAREGVPKAGMGVAVADIDADGDADLLVGNLHQEADSVFVNDGSYFSDMTVRAGLGAASRPFTRFGLGLFDFDQDGWLDLYQANGRVTLGDDPRQKDPFAEPNLLFRGLPGGRFEEVLPRGGTALPLVATSRGAAFGDWDGDGAIDLVVSNRDAPISLLRNATPNRGHWAILDVRERTGAPAIGASVEARIGDAVVVREVRSASSYLSASDPRVHLGLAAHGGIESVRVTWNDGDSTTFSALGADRVHRLQRPDGPFSSSPED